MENRHRRAPFLILLFFCLVFDSQSLTIDSRPGRDLSLNDNSSASNDLSGDDSPVVFRQNKSHPHLVRKQNSRFLNIFSIIDIPNTACRSSHKPLRELNGTCYHPNQCAKLGGLGHGKCADGYGVCCFCESCRVWC